jgi:sRNA-binding protein
MKLTDEQLEQAEKQIAQRKEKEEQQRRDALSAEAAAADAKVTAAREFLASDTYRDAKAGLAKIAFDFMHETDATYPYQMLPRLEAVIARQPVSG